ncbi:MULTISPECIES: transposase, partial [Aphanothece]|uniref:transposase n=1 Tax=Aphanothece TaxID=1121 RepID=UPI00398540D6
RQNSSGRSSAGGGPSKKGDACLREALFLAANQVRRFDPTLARRYQRLMCETGRHHNSAVCTVATVLLTRITACLRAGVPYVIRDVDGREISKEEGKAIVKDRYAIPETVRAARRTIRKRSGKALGGVATLNQESQSAPKRQPPPRQAASTTEAWQALAT